MSSLVCNRGVRISEILFGFGYKISEPSKNLTSMQTVFQQKLCAIRSSNIKSDKITFLAFSVQIKNVLKQDQSRV